MSSSLNKFLEFLSKQGFRVIRNQSGIGPESAQNQPLASSPAGLSTLDEVLSGAAGPVDNHTDHKTATEIDDMGAPDTVPFLSVGELADFLGVQTWQIARLFERGLVREPPRISGRRIIPKCRVPEIIDRLRDCGWLGIESGAG